MRYRGRKRVSDISDVINMHALRQTLNDAIYPSNTWRMNIYSTPLYERKL